MEFGSRKRRFNDDSPTNFSSYLLFLLERRTRREVFFNPPRREGKADIPSFYYTVASKRPLPLRAITAASLPSPPPLHYRPIIPFVRTIGKHEPFRFPNARSFVDLRIRRVVGRLNKQDKRSNFPRAKYARIS